MDCILSTGHCFSRHCDPTSGRPEEYLKSQRVEFVNLNDPTGIEMMSRFVAECPRLWNEDIGVPDEPATVP